MSKYSLMIVDLLVELNKLTGHDYTWHVTSYGWFEAYVKIGNKDRAFLFSFHTRKELYTALLGILKNTYIMHYATLSLSDLVALDRMALDY